MNRLEMTVIELKQKLAELLPINNVFVGITDINTISNQYPICKCDAGLRADLGNGVIAIQKKNDTFINSFNINYYRGAYDLPNNWKEYLGFTIGSGISECESQLVDKKFKFIHRTKNDNIWIVVSPNNLFIISIHFDFEGVNELDIILNKCPYCKAEEIEYNINDTDEVYYSCSCCSKSWGCINDD